MDKVDKETRSKNMAAVRSADTKPELLVRSALHKLGFRFRIHYKGLPGKPDVVFPSRKIALFVHGCFWHHHNCRKGRLMPVSNAEFWRKKIERNVERDKQVKDMLQEKSWRTIVVWECQTRRKDWADRLIKKIKSFG
jgi:DNA mismatch endonuclease (patch repair protein)